MSIFEYTLQLWQQIFGATFSEANATLISDLSVITTVAMIVLFIAVLCCIVRAIYRRCTP